MQGNDRRSRQEGPVCRTTSEQKELLSFCLCAVRWWVWVLVSGWSIVGAGFLVVGLLVTVPASAKPTTATKHNATSDAAAAPGSKLSRNPSSTHAQNGVPRRAGIHRHKYYLLVHRGFQLRSTSQCLQGCRQCEPWSAHAALSWRLAAWPADPVQVRPWVV